MSGVLSARQGSREELGGEASPFKRRGRQRVCSHGPRFPPSCESKAPVRWVERPKCGGLVRNPLHSFDTHADPIVWNSSVAEASFHLAAVSSPEANFRLKAAFPAAGLGGPLQHKAVRAAMDRHRGGHVDAHRSAPQRTAAHRSIRHIRQNLTAHPTGGPHFYSTPMSLRGSRTYVVAVDPHGKRGSGD